MTKYIATRLKIILIEIISKNQSGFIKGQYIGDNIRSLRSWESIWYSQLEIKKKMSFFF
jgi:hypothetical protein